MSEPYWALAAGCVPDVLPWEIPNIARSAGFQSCGMWVDPDTTWDDQALSKTRAALDETGIQLIDVEALWLAASSKASDNHKIAIDAGLALGARNLLVVSVHEDYELSVAQFQDLCRHAGEDIRVNLEFGEFTQIKSLPAAQQFIADVNHPSAGILIDLMHLNRAGDKLPELSDDTYSYVQACDFYQSSKSMSGPQYIEAAVDFRCPLGEGEASKKDIEAVCLANKDVSLEIRSKKLRDEYSDPVQRAKQIYARCQRITQTS